MDYKKWMNDIGRKMEDFEMSPPENLWEDIERQVHTNFAKHKTVKLYNRRTWTAAAMLTGILVIGGGVWLNTHQKEGSMLQSEGSHPTITQTYKTPTTPSLQVEGNTLAKGHDAPFPSICHAKPNSKTVVAQQLNTHCYQIEVGDTSQAETTKRCQTQQSCSNKPKRQNKTHQTLYRNNTFLASRHSEESRFSISLTAANFMSSNNQQGGYGELLVGSIWQGNSEEGVKGDNNLSDEFGSLEEVIAGNNNKDVYTKKKHHQPVKVGVSVNYHLSDRWSVGTGLTYSYLSSELTSGTEDSHYTTNQKLQYVGIPVNISYTFYRYKQWSVYGTTGGMVEKCVKGKSTTEFTIGGKQATSQYDDVNEKRLQYSVNAAVGIQAKIAEHIGFYLEPGISYHFDNHSNVTNIYKDTPLNFSLGLGFRYSF